MAIAEDKKLHEGDIVSVQGKIEMIYFSTNTGEERIVLKLDGYYQTVAIPREHLTFVRPFIEKGMVVRSRERSGALVTVDVVLGDKWIVGRESETSRPVTYSIDNVEIVRDEEEDEEPLPEVIEDLPAIEAAPELEEMEPRRTVDPSLQHGYPLQPGIGFLGDSIVRIAKAHADIVRGSFDD